MRNSLSPLGRGAALAALALGMAVVPARSADDAPTAREVLDGLRAFYRKTALPDGSFRPGVDPDAYRGMSRQRAPQSDMAPLTYAGRAAPHLRLGPPRAGGRRTTANLPLARQKEDGAFYHVRAAPATPRRR